MLEWIAAHNHELAHAGDGVWLALASLVSYYMIRLLRKTSEGPVHTLALGILLVAVCSAIHRAWWLVGAFMSSEPGTYAPWAYTYNGMLTFLVVILAAGYSLHIKTALNGKTKLWWLQPLGLGVLGGIAGWLI